MSVDEMPVSGPADVDGPAGVLGVLGAVGGVGTSSLAAAVAARWGRGVLIDLDWCGAGLDVALEIDHLPGVRWSGLHGDGGRVDPVELVRRLPRWRGVAVLAADGPVRTAAVRPVLQAAATAGPVVVDVGRGCAEAQRAAVRVSTATVVVSTADVAGVAAGHAVRRLHPDARLGLVVRRGDMPAVEAAASSGLPLVGGLPGTPRRREGGRVSTARAVRATARAVTGWMPR